MFCIVFKLGLPYFPLTFAFEIEKESFSPESVYRLHASSIEAYKKLIKNSGVWTQSIMYLSQNLIPT